VKVQFTPSARRQFLSAIAFIRRDKPAAATRFRHKVEGKLRRLEDFPESGRRIPEFPDLPYRELIAAPYRLFYRVHGDSVWVVAVWHGAQIPAEPDDKGA
jgi:plasmid stabilization system protein ParE